MVPSPVGYPVTLSSSLSSPSTDATDHVCYTFDVCNHFSSLPIEIESNVGVIPAVNLHWKVMESYVSSLVGEAVTTPTIVATDVPDRETAVKLALAE